MKSMYDVTQRHYIRLWITYGTAFTLLFLLGYFFSQGVINQPWTARTHMGTAVLDGFIYVVGGQSKTTGDLLADIWEVDPGQACLRPVAALPYDCYRPEVAVTNNMLFVLGGYDGDTYRSEILRLANGKIETIGRFPTPRGYGASIGVGSSLYYAGGGNHEGILDEIVHINPNTGEVSVVAHFSSPRRFVSAAQLGDLIYFVGGETSESTLSDEVIEFDPAIQEIVRIGHLPSGRYLVNVVTWNGHLLALGGKRTRSLDDVVSISVSESTITSEVIDNIDALSWSLSVEAVNDRLFIVGGEHPEFKRAIGLIEYSPTAEPSLHAIQLRKNPWK